MKVSSGDCAIKDGEDGEADEEGGGVKVPELGGFGGCKRKGAEDCAAEGGGGVQFPVSRASIGGSEDGSPDPKSEVWKVVEEAKGGDEMVACCEESSVVGVCTSKGRDGDSGITHFVSDSGPASGVVETGGPAFARPSSVYAGKYGPTVKEISRAAMGNYCGGKFVSERRKICSSRTLYVNNIPPSVSFSSIKAWFSHFGSVVDVFILKKKNKVNGFSFAFVRFRHEFEALQACEKADGSIFEGFVLEVNVSRYPRIFHKSIAGLVVDQN